MDLVVTVPKDQWKTWLAEGDCAGDPPTGKEWVFWAGARRPPIHLGERLYIVAHNKLRGYAPVTFVLTRADPGRSPFYGICRHSNAVACTIDTTIRGFRGWRKVWWTREDERPFPEWQTP